MFQCCGPVQGTFSLYCLMYHLFSWRYKFQIMSCSQGVDVGFQPISGLPRCCGPRQTPCSSITFSDTSARYLLPLILRFLFRFLFEGFILFIVELDRKVWKREGKTCSKGPEVGIKPWSLRYGLGLDATKSHWDWPPLGANQRAVTALPLSSQRITRR